MKDILLLSFILFIGCSPNKRMSSQQSKAIQGETFKIAFGSCSNHEKKQKLWDDVIAERPDLWIWLGDNIYGDTDDMALLKSKYDKQKADPLYQKLKKQTRVLGVWDDHDYGMDDVGKEFPKKAESQQLLLDFLDVPSDDIRRTQAGIYKNEIIELEEMTISILLLDTRYFRDSIFGGSFSRIPNPDGTILGEVQWTWLENEFKTSTADIHIIASSIQVIPEEHIFEKWANFPKDRKRLFDLLLKYDVKAPIFISGDRHLAEISKQKMEGETFYDITSSSLTHSIPIRIRNKNRHRIGKTIFKENYGIIEISKNDQSQINAYIKSNGQIVRQFEQIVF